MRRADRKTMKKINKIGSEVLPLFICIMWIIIFYNLK